MVKIIELLLIIGDTTIGKTSVIIFVLFLPSIKFMGFIKGKC